MRRSLSIAIVLGTCAVSLQTALAEVAQRAEVAAPPAIEAPVQIINNRIHIPVSVRGAKAGSFALDTGAARTCIDDQFARSIGVEGSDRATAAGAAASVEITLARDVSMRFAGIEHKTDRLPLIPLGPVSLRVGRPMDGVLGHDVLQRFVTEIDYVREVVTFRDPTRYTPPEGAAIVPLRFLHAGVPIISATVTLLDGRKLPVSLLVDTGAGMAVRLSRRFAEANKIDTSELMEGSGGVGVGGATSDRFGRIAAVSFGGLTFENPVAFFANDRGGSIASSGVDGLIGGEILRRLNVTVDYPRKRFILVPNQRFSAPFETDMTGLSLTSADHSYERLVVRDVRPETPAAVAGFQVGDEVRSIDGENVKPFDLEKIRDLFRVPGKSYAITVVREGTEQVLTIKTRRLV